MKKYNLSAIMHKAWELVKTFGATMSVALKMAWKEAKEQIAKVADNADALVDKLVANLEDMCYSYDYHIHAGTEREVYVREDKDNHRKYLSIACYTANRRYKGNYKSGYVDMVTKEYHTGKYDVIDALKKEWIGR